MRLHDAVQKCPQVDRRVLRGFALSHVEQVAQQSVEPANLFQDGLECRGAARIIGEVSAVQGRSIVGEHLIEGRGDVDRSYVRCLKVLMSGQGYPMVATHDPRLVEIAGADHGLARLEDVARVQEAVGAFVDRL